MGFLRTAGPQAFAEIRNWVLEQFGHLLRRHPVATSAILGAVIGAYIGHQVGLWIPLPHTAIAGGIIGGVAGGISSRRIAEWIGNRLGNNAIVRIAANNFYSHISDQEIEGVLNNPRLGLDLDQILILIQQRLAENNPRPLEGVLADMLINPLANALEFSVADARFLAAGLVGSLVEHRELELILEETLQVRLMRSVDGLDNEVKQRILREACYVVIYASRRFFPAGLPAILQDPAGQGNGAPEQGRHLHLE